MRIAPPGPYDQERLGTSSLELETPLLCRDRWGHGVRNTQRHAYIIYNHERMAIRLFFLRTCVLRTCGRRRRWLRWRWCCVTWDMETWAASRRTFGTAKHVGMGTEGFFFFSVSGLFFLHFLSWSSFHHMHTHPTRMPLHASVMNIYVR